MAVPRAHTDAPFSPLAIRKFWQKVEQIPESSCWHWVGAIHGKGYGSMTVDTKYYSAHRFSWILHNGPIPNGEGPHGICVCHKCDVPTCVNPDHLFLGTTGDNTADCIRKGRAHTERLRKRTHCKHGHEFTPENTYMVMPTKRRCRACSAETAARFRKLHPGYADEYK